MKKLILFALLFIILSSCGNNNTENIKPDESSAPVETTVKEIKDNVPAMTFGGETINILEYDRAAETLIKAQIHSTGENGDLINDTIFRRNLVIEDRFDIKINSVLSTTVIETAKRVILANEGIYDLINERIFTSKDLASKNMFINLKELPYVDFTKSWWDQQATNDLSITHKHFINISASDITATHHTWVIMFNKVLMDNIAMEYPYQLVRDGKWTLDKFYNMIIEINPRDLNGDGVMDEHDFWGLCSEYYNTAAMFSGAGERLFRKNSDDIPYVSMNTERAVIVLDKIFDIVYNKNITATAQHFIGFNNSFYEV